MKTILCMKWGTLYAAEYVNRLYSMVSRNVTGPLRFVCLTDDAEGVDDRVEIFPCPSLPIEDPRRNLGWRKLSLFAPEVADIEGAFLYLDLDIVVVDSLDPLFEVEGDYVVMRNWTQPKERIGNTSVFKLRVGSDPDVLAAFLRDPSAAFAGNNNSQTYVSRTARTMAFFPDDWCVLFKVHCVPPMPARWFVEPKLPPGARVVAFPGRPNPHEAAEGHWPAPWHKRVYKHIRPVSWVKEHWR
jgi:hypothetical protein